MPVPVREAAVVAVEARLRAMLPDAVVERARRAPVDPARERVPRLVLTAQGVVPDETQEPGRTHYSIEFEVAGYVRGAADLECEQLLSDLHARIVAALAGWEPGTVGLGDVAEQGAEFAAHAAETGRLPTGEVVARFAIRAETPVASPFL
jgi:hypothetical protein